MFGRIFQFVVISFVSLPLLGSHFAAAQSDGDDVSIGKWREIESNVLGEKRKIIVSKPSGYDSNKNKRYAVVYVLDGSCTGSELVCDDDGGDGLDSLVTLDATAGATYIIVLFSIERCLVVVDPFRWISVFSLRKAQAAVAVLVLVSCVACSPALFSR